MTFVEYFEKFEKMQRWVISDLLNSSIKAHANFLVAMGIFNYIEILGSFYITETNRGSCTRRFMHVVNNLLPEEYLEECLKIETTTGSTAYDCLRNGMTHEYFVKTYRVNNTEIDINFTIYGVENETQYVTNVLSEKCGIKLLQFDRMYHIRIYNPRLIFDLNEAFKLYKTKLIENETEYRNRFIQRCRDIHLEKFN